MRPKLEKGWIHCLAMFIPEGTTEEDWSVMGSTERDKIADWRGYRFDPEYVCQYNRGGYLNTTTVRYKNGDAMTVQGKLEEFDELLAKT